MQRLHQKDPSAVLLEKADDENPVRHVKLPGEVRGNPRHEVRPRKYARYYVGGLLDTKRLPKVILRDLEKSLGPSYAGQILQRPTPREGGLFKVNRLVIEQAPRPIEFTRLCRFWDKAGTRDGGAFTVGLLMGVDKKDRYWVLDVVRGQWDSGERESIILQTAQVDIAQWGKRYEVGVEQEPGSGGKESAEGTARRLAGYRVRIERPTGDKETRAEPYSVQVNTGNVLLAQGPWNREYISELQYFPRSSNKDQVDASSGAFTLLTKQRVVGGAIRPIAVGTLTRTHRR
jgi:predicted phage terminase large subunit-like protein